MERDVETLWRARLRWRFRGALLWPAFIALTAFDAILLGFLPISGEGGTPLVPAALLAMFFNLVAVALVMPFVALWWRRRRPDLPKVVAQDQVGTALLACVTLALLGGGLLHAPVRAQAERDFDAQLEAARAYARAEAPPEFRAHAARTSTLKLEDELFRTCVPGDDPLRWFCVYVDTTTSPPGITEDENRESNASLNRPGGF
jgi:hypothetical protein